MLNSGQKSCCDIIWIITLFFLTFISLAAGTCKQGIKDGHGLYAVMCTCYNPNEDFEITPEISISFINASSVGISHCRNVVLHSNLFRRSYDLHNIMISHLDELSFDPALSFPVSLRKLSLLSIGSLDHFPVPGPSSAILHSVKHLDLFSLEDVTVKAPPITSTSSFIDLPITKVHMNSVKFVGTIPKGTLHFNTSTLAHFSMVKCQFDDMVMGSLYINATENVTITDCKFKRMEQESMKVYGKSISFSNNLIQNLSATHSILIDGQHHISVINNSFKALGESHALLLSSNKDAFVYIKDNWFPCGCYAENFIPAASNNASQCKANDFLVCALQQKQHCVHANGRNGTIQISRSELPFCPDTEQAQGSAERGQTVNQVTLIALWIGFFLIHMN